MALTRPLPNSKKYSGLISYILSAVAESLIANSLTVKSGNWDLINPATPAATGEAIEVPENDA